MDSQPTDPRTALLARLKALEETPLPSEWPAVEEEWEELNPDAEDWDLRPAMAAVARAFALVDLKVAEAAVDLVQLPDLAAKTKHRIYLKIEDEAARLVDKQPEAALALVRPLAPRYRYMIQAAAAALIFATDQPRALALYRDLAQPYWAWAFLKRIVPLAPDLALALAAEFPAGVERDRGLGELAERLAAVDFAKAERLADSLTDESVKSKTYRGLLPHRLVQTPEELFALFAEPRYAPFRIPVFAEHENILRTWCNVPQLTPGMAPLSLPDVGGDPEYWAIHRKITYSVEADPAGALALLRSLDNPAWRFRIFEYARAQFLNLR